MARKKKKEEGEEKQIVVFNLVDVENGNSNGIVKKAEQLVTSRYTLTTMEIKIISCLISMIRDTDTESTEYVFKVSDWKNERGLRRKDLHKAFREIAKGLMKKPITIEDLKTGDWIVVNWVSSAKYVSGEGIVKFKISDELKPFLLNLKKKFLKYDIKNILPLRSAYTIRIYEILKDWYMIGARYNSSKVIKKIVELDWLRKTLQIPDKYKYNDIKRQIIEKAKTDLPKYTDIVFEYEEIKTARKVTHLKFFISKKVTTENKQIESLKDINKLLALLPAEYATASAENLIKNYVRDKGIEYVKKQIEYVNTTNPKNYLGYLNKALQGDYAGVESVEITEKDKKITIEELRKTYAGMKYRDIKGITRIVDIQEKQEKSEIIVIIERKNKKYALEFNRFDLVADWLKNQEQFIVL